MFAVVGVDLFGGEGKLVPDSSRLEDLPWYSFSMEINFLDFQNALIALFFTSTTSKWIPVMEAAVAVTKPDLIAYFYFIGFRLILFMVFIPLFVGIMVQSIIVKWEEVRRKAKNELERPKNFTEKSLDVALDSCSYSMRMDSSVQLVVTRKKSAGGKNIAKRSSTRYLFMRSK